MYCTIISILSVCLHVSGAVRGSLVACGRTYVCVVPSVTQDGGVVQRSSPIAVRLVDVGAVLQQELTGCQSVLFETQEHGIAYMFTGAGSVYFMLLYQ